MTFLVAPSASTQYQDCGSLRKLVVALLFGVMHIKRFDILGFRPNQHYIREMQKYGILPTNLPEDGLLNPYEIDKRYWRSHHYIPSEQ